MVISIVKLDINEISLPTFVGIEMTAMSSNLIKSVTPCHFEGGTPACLDEYREEISTMYYSMRFLLTAFVRNDTLLSSYVCKSKRIGINLKSLLT